MDNQDNFVSPALNVLTDKLGTTVVDLASTSKMNYREKFALLLYAGHKFVPPNPEHHVSLKERERLKVAYIARISKVSQERLKYVRDLILEEGF